MADYQEHLSQANKNIRILVKNNLLIPESTDWQVTMSFYAAVHFANAHIAKKVNQHYRSHAKVEEALNPFVPVNPSAISEKAFLSYGVLRGLARRSRYLCSDDEGNHSEGFHPITEKHLAKGIRCLDDVMEFFSDEYGYHFSQLEISCNKIKNDKLKYFKAKEETAHAV